MLICTPNICPRRPSIPGAAQPLPLKNAMTTVAAQAMPVENAVEEALMRSIRTVSYTHLTLPTSDLV